MARQQCIVYCTIAHSQILTNHCLEFSVASLVKILSQFHKIHRNFWFF